MLEIPVVSALNTGHHEGVITAVTDHIWDFPGSLKNANLAAKKRLDFQNSWAFPTALLSLQPCWVLQDLVDVKDVH